MLDLLRKYRVYYTIATILVVFGFISLLWFPKGGAVLWFDKHSSEGMDTFFLLITQIGEILGAIIVLLVLVFFADKKFRVIFPISVVLMLFISQGLKHFVYEDEHRPSYTYKSLHYIDGLERHANNSFPSGHTTAAFSYLTLIALAFKKKYVQVLAPVIAALVGVSRVYLGQHYLHDVVVGAVLGIVLATLVTHLYSSSLNKKKGI